MTVYEMEGFLRGKCLPGDMKVNESNAQYLVRKFSELQSQNADMAVQLANAESKCRELAVENAGLKNPDNWLSQSDYGYEASEVATQNGATEDESLRAGMIAIINRIGTPATDDFLAEVRAQGVEMLVKHCEQKALEKSYDFFMDAGAVAAQFAAQIRKGDQ
ncbi:TPA: hypothetical protein MNC29_005099 [Citrobacter freundii]|uniref:hypothetical protein n=1 Tax=Citrobacter freundii TaxID=546 RepID=UPI001BCD4E79|nr:hypothetical protein [Citrobacter freundii]EIN8656650.1 hypothetical protein [Citrobacter freundii]HBZ9067944.1 hypothetical protein [Citrobacter freundii]HBZ9266767.1 hypothetical protein [Citrobacter freundii]HBZ9383535.1 hypothetical protein [Citrobacter freundii]HBZ9647262.1 hypothetical protein [Citrobacter freundii]